MTPTHSEFRCCPHRRQSNGEYLTDENYAFIEEMYELAFGCSAIDRDFSHEEVIERLREFCDNAFKYKRAYNLHKCECVR
jgi:hypothetical protein